jgi:copper(I)-binding protein
MLKLSLLAFSAAALAACSPAAPKLNVHDGWSRATGQAETAAAYVTIDNRGGADKLAGVRSTIGQATLHESTMEGGVMRMRPIDPGEGLDVPSNGTLRQAPAGAHVKIMGL